MLATVYLARNIGYCNVGRDFVDRIECLMVLGPTRWCNTGCRPEGNADFAERIAEYLKENGVTFVDLVNTGKMLYPGEIGSGPAADYADDLLGRGLDRGVRELALDELGYNRVKEVLSKDFKVVEFPSDEHLAVNNFVNLWAAGLVKPATGYGGTAIPFDCSPDTKKEWLDRLEDDLWCGCISIEITDEKGSHFTCSCSDEFKGKEAT